MEIHSYYKSIINISFPFVFYILEHFLNILDLSNKGDEDETKEGNKTSVFYIAVGVIFSLLLIIATLVCYLHVRAIPKPEDENLLSHQV